MATTGRVKAWKDILDKNISLPVAYDRQQKDPSKSSPFNITIKTIDGVRSKVDFKATDYLIKLNLFDLTFKQFFGRTWTSSPVQAKKDGQHLKLQANQNVYFHTPLNDEGIAVVMEIIGVSRGDDGKMDQRSCGWNVMRIFKFDSKMLDTSSASIPPTQKLSVYYGSPAALPYLDEQFEASSQVNAIPGCMLHYTVRTHAALTKALHLLPENCIVGNNDVIPGLAEGPKDPKLMIPDSLRKPRLLKSFPSHIEKISVTFGSPLDKLEEEICRLLNNDRLTVDKKPTDGGALQITKRQLMDGHHSAILDFLVRSITPERVDLQLSNLVGVHNGWAYVTEPETVGLQPQDSGSLTSFKRTGSKRGHKRTSSVSSIGSANALVHKNRVELDGMVEDPSFVVVFTLIYEVSEASNTKDKKMSMAHAGFPVSIRWAAWCPLSNLSAQDHTVQLVGGPGPNPEETLVFYSHAIENLGSNASMSGLAGGSISFSFLHEKRGKENMPINIMDAAGQMLHLQPGSARAPSRGSIQTDASSVLQEMAFQGKPPIYPGRPGTGPMAHEGHLQVPQTGISPSQTYMGSPMGPYGTALPYTTTPRGYMPVEIQHLRESGGSPLPSARMGIMSPDLQELPFTPVHAPIMAVAPGMHSGQALSRAGYAKLYTAGFQPILDRNGEPAEVVDPNDLINFIAAKEDMDRLKSNEIHLQFLAYARTMSFEGAGVKRPSTVFFTFQFYRYPQVTTERLLLGNADGLLGNDPQSVPNILQRLDKDGSILKGPPGFMLKYMVDPAYMKPGEGRLFVHHLSQQTLHIDVWDGDSLHLIGSCAVELKHLCRQNREAVQVTYELDVVSQEILEPDGTLPAGDTTRDGMVLPTTLHQTVKGRLHLRMANVGRFPETKLTKADTMPQPESKLIVKGETGTAFMGGSLNAVKEQIKAGLAFTKVAKAKHVADTNHELAQILFSRREQAQQEATGHHGGVDKKRKMTRMEAVRTIHGNDKIMTMPTIRQEKEERARDLKTIEIFREQSKRDGILNMLSQAISTEHTINPALGNTEFFEYVLRNPYNTEHTVTVETDDPELMVITDPKEWRHFKMMKEIYTSVEEGMFNTESKSGKPEIFLRPKESVNVPFKFLTFKADHSVQPQTPSDPYKPQTKRGTFHKKPKEDPLQTRIAKIFFRTNEEKPISILNVRIEPQPHIIDQTFRFHHPEQSFLKKSIRLPQLHTMPGMPIGGGLSQVWVKCSDNNVICTSRKVQQGEPHDIYLKVACGASPQVKRFFMAIYTDAYLSRPIQVWQFYIHAMQRVDVSCTEGQTSRFTLLLRGTQASRLVQCYPSNPNEMQISPAEPFMLAANTLQEVYIGVRPMQAGSKFLFINVVDMEYHQLIRSWLVCVACKASEVVKAYEINLPVGRSSNKRVAYMNPYPSKKEFYLRTNREDLLQFKESIIELGAGDSTHMGLKFAPSMAPGSVELLVFINDSDDKNEETICIKANYQ